jgi:hypothetical protein
MNGTTYYLGYRNGWKLATTYATGTRRDRAAIRRRLELLKDSFGQFARGLWDVFADLAEQRSEAIRAGLAPRTIRPTRLERVLERIAV